jgi:SAM-dependent methyltransferase
VEEEHIDAKKRYQSKRYALRYKEEYTGGWKVKSLRSRAVAKCEISVIRNMLKSVRLMEEKGSMLLDIPCGTGKLGRMLSAFPIQIIAGDVSNEMMSLARGEYGQDNLVTFIRCDAERIPLDDHSVDNIICLRLFQRVTMDAQKKILSEFRRVVTGHLIVSYSQSSFFQQILGRVRDVFKGKRNMLHKVSPQDMESQIEEAGFRQQYRKSMFCGLSSEVIILAKVKE